MQNEWNEDVILFFHSFTGSKEYYPKIKDDINCIISFDRPGVGESSVVKYYLIEIFLRNIYDVLKSHNVLSIKSYFTITCNIVIYYSYALL